MSLSFFDTLFEEYLVNIALTKSQSSSIDRKLEETLSLFLAEYNADVEIYSQGSYAMGTTVRPLTASQSLTGQAGEYDVDIVLERTTWGGAGEALQSVRNVLADEYAEKLDVKLRDSCERVFHAVDEDTEVGFHVDYVPIKNTFNTRKAAKRPTGEWFNSDTKQLVEWFADISGEHIFLPSIILILKRIRDNAGLTNVLSSICITALVCNSYRQTESYAEDLLSIVGVCVDTFNVAHSDLSIRVDPLEDDLADRIDVDQHQAILAFFREVKLNLEQGFSRRDLNVLRSVLSSSFPAEIDNFPMVLEALRRRGWGIETNGSLKRVDIAERGNGGSFVSKVKRRFYQTGAGLVFHATPYDKNEFGIRWQVLNAAGSPDRRGRLFEAKGANGRTGSNSNEYINHEIESYTGEHWIKYYIYHKSSKRVVEIGKKFFVEVAQP